MECYTADHVYLKPVLLWYVQCQVLGWIGDSSQSVDLSIFEDYSLGLKGRVKCGYLWCLLEHLSVTDLALKLSF